MGVQYHPVLKNTSAIMALFLLHTSGSDVMDTKIPDLNVFFQVFFVKISSLVGEQSSLKTKLHPLAQVKTISDA